LGRKGIRFSKDYRLHKIVVALIINFWFSENYLINNIFAHYHHIISTWRWLNEVPLRDTKDALMANYICFEMKRRETGEVVYRNNWITDKPVTEENIERLVPC
jgi:hypothetical protein